MDLSTVKALGLSAVHILFPTVCMVCGRVLIVGDNCSQGLYEMNICTHCFSRFPIRDSGSRWFSCLSDPYEDDPISDFGVWTLFRYESPVTDLLRGLKFHSLQNAGELLGHVMGREFGEWYGQRADAVIPIPLSEKRKKKRGYNQASILGQGIASYLDTPLLENVLVRVRHTKQQSRFSDPVRRELNIEGAFGVSETWDVTGWNIILVDDILTTGATMHEAAKALVEKGASSVVGVTCASHR